MKAKHLCPVPKGLFPSGKMTKLPLNWPCSLRATVKGLALLKRQRSLDLLDSATIKSLISLWNEVLRDLNALKPGPRAITAGPMRSYVRSYAIDFLIPRCLRRG